MPIIPINRTLLQDVPLFAGLDGAALDDILAEAVSQLYSTGDTVFEQGEIAAHFFVLLHGRLKVGQVTEDGQQVMVRIINPGDLFGIAKALQRPDYPGTARAAADSVALCWPMDSWDRIIQTHPQFTVRAMQTMGQRLQEAQGRLRELATEEVERRIAHTVLRLIQQSGKKEEGGLRIDFPISRQDIAEMTGTTLHTVSRTLSAWEHAGIVRGGRQKLSVTDPHQLLLIADGVADGYL